MTTIVTSICSAMPETTNMNRQLFLEWFPQIIYDHHQTGPQGAVIFMPPFRDPFNYNFDPLIPLGIELVGTAMQGLLVEEGKGGSGMRSESGWLHMVERRLAHDQLLPQHDRDSHRDCRQPDTHANSSGRGTAIAVRGFAAAHRSAVVALPPIDRVRNYE